MKPSRLQLAARPLSPRLIVIVLVMAGCLACGNAATSGERSIFEEALAPSTTAERVGEMPVPTTAGRVVEAFAPEGSDRVAVVGIGVGETLAMRALPGFDQPIATELPSTVDDLFGVGESFETPDGQVWWFVRWSNFQGWIDPEHAAYLGEPVDITDEALGQLQSTSFGSMAEMVNAVAGQFGTDYVVVEVQPTGSDNDAATTVDILDGTAASSGYRLVIEGTETDGVVWFSSASRTTLCRRGIAVTGACL